jgi:hypothetical protein
MQKPIEVTGRRWLRDIGVYVRNCEHRHKEKYIKLFETVGGYSTICFISLNDNYRMVGQTSRNTYWGLICKSQMK